MFARIKKHKKISLVILVALSVWLYQELRPTIIFHTPQESKYLGKISEIDGCIEKIYTEKHIARYRLPYKWQWKEEDEVAIFFSNYGDVLHKDDLDFWRKDVYLDEDKNYVRHTKRKYFRLYEE